MSLRLKTLATLNVAAWLIAVPLLLASLLSPIVGFNGWQDTSCRAAATPRCNSPTRPIANRRARLRRLPPGAIAPAPMPRPPRRPRPRRRLASPPPRRARTCAPCADAPSHAGGPRSAAAWPRGAVPPHARPSDRSSRPRRRRRPSPCRSRRPSRPSPRSAVAQHAVPASVKVHKLKAPKVKAPKASRQGQAAQGQTAQGQTAQAAKPQRPPRTSPARDPSSRRKADLALERRRRSAEGGRMRSRLARLAAVDVLAWVVGIPLLAAAVPRRIPPLQPRPPGRWLAPGPGGRDGAPGRPAPARTGAAGGGGAAGRAPPGRAAPGRAAAAGSAAAALIRRRRPAPGRPGRRPAGPRSARPASSASCPPSGARAACACA